MLRKTNLQTSTIKAVLVQWVIPDHTSCLLFALFSTSCDSSSMSSSESVGSDLEPRSISSADDLEVLSSDSNIRLWTSSIRSIAFIIWSCCSFILPGLLTGAADAVCPDDVDGVTSEARYDVEADIGEITGGSCADGSQDGRGLLVNIGTGRVLLDDSMSFVSKLSDWRLFWWCCMSDNWQWSERTIITAVNTGHLDAAWLPVNAGASFWQRKLRLGTVVITV